MCTYFFLLFHRTICQYSYYLCLRCTSNFTIIGSFNQWSLSSELFWMAGLLFRVSELEWAAIVSALHSVCLCICKWLWLPKNVAVANWDICCFLGLDKFAVHCFWNTKDRNLCDSFQRNFEDFFGTDFFHSYSCCGLCTDPFDDVFQSRCSG